MDFYKSELNAIKKRGILRKRKVFAESCGKSCAKGRTKGRESKKSLADFASNDYLGLSNRADSLHKAYKLTINPKLSAPRASMLVNGYSKLHRRLERKLARINGFESCILVGSGFLANIALIESLVRKGDKIFIDEEYHASGILASKLVQGVEFFKHNDCVDLENKILLSLQGGSHESHESHPDSSLRDSRCELKQSTINLVARSATKSRPLRGAKNRIQGCSSATADFLLEADKRGTPPKSEKAAAFWRVGGAGRGGVQPFLRKDSSESNGQNDANLIDSTLQHCDSHNLDSRDLDCFGDSVESPRNDDLVADSPKQSAGFANAVKQQSKSPKETTRNRILIAIEGIYSMSGDIAPKGFAKIAQKYNAILIVDEAHSSGTLGKNLNGYFDYHRLKIAPNFIKLGTFSKALGSYGAYILSSSHINSYLQTRAKPIIYSTALSAFDSALALTNLNFIHKNRARFAKKIAQIKKIIQKNLKIKLDSQIFSIQFQSQNEMLKTFRNLKKRGFLVGAIRTPSVKIPQLRIILSTKHSKKDIIRLCKLLKK